MTSKVEELREQILGTHRQLTGGTGAGMSFGKYPCMLTPEILDSLISAAHAEGVAENRAESDIVGVPLNKGQIAIIDAADAERVLKYKWYVRPDKHGGFYAKACIDGKKTGLHRFILDAPQGMDVDHINHNPLDNRRCNIRVCTRAQNMMGQKPHSGSPYKGVSFITEKKKWIAQIGVSSKNIHLGYFDNEVDAARAYNEAAKKHFGEYALLNPSILAPTKEKP